MGSTIRLELRKMVDSLGFKVILVIAMGLSLVDGIVKIMNYQINGYERSSLLTNWMMIHGMSVPAAIFWNIFPLLATFAFGWSYIQEKKSGYIRQWVIREGKKRYFINKFLVTFFSGGIVIVAPIVFHLFLLSLFIPYQKIESIYLIEAGVSFNHFYGNIFYENHFLYILLMIVLTFLYSGVVACMSLVVAIFITNRNIVVLLPYLILLSIYYFTTFGIDYSQMKYMINLSPFNWVCASTVTSEVVEWVVILFIGLLLFIELLLFLGWEERREIY